MLDLIKILLTPYLPNPKLKSIIVVRGYELILVKKSEDVVQYTTKSRFLQRIVKSLGNSQILMTEGYLSKEEGGDQETYNQSIKNTVKNSLILSLAKENLDGKVLLTGSCEGVANYCNHNVNGFTLIRDYIILIDYKNLNKALEKFV